MYINQVYHNFHVIIITFYVYKSDISQFLLIYTQIRFTEFLLYVTDLVVAASSLNLVPNLYPNQIYRISTFHDLPFLMTP